MNKHRLFYIVALILSVVSCNRQEDFGPDVPGVFNVSFIETDAAYQSVSEAPAVDRLLIDVYESGTSSPKTYSYSVKNGIVERGIDIPFKEGCSYEVYLWAHK